tara:strand:- start:257 stop:688 length:432 start_codon:yes stop_codon:yes gene_type:complete
MEPWEEYLRSTDEFEQMKQEYEKWFSEDIQESTPLYDFALQQIELHLFLADSSDEDIMESPSEDLQYKRGRAALIFQLGMERDPVDVVGILKCIQYWARDNCKHCEYGGIIPFLSEIFNEQMESPQSGEEYEELAMILFGEGE